VKEGIVVSTLAELEFFGEAGFDDIMYGVPVTPDKLPQAAKWAARLSKFHIVGPVDDADAVRCANASDSCAVSWRFQVVDSLVMVEALEAHGPPCAGGRP
jgi:D-serine deaminase-like pyridoxal phosphate-dependent protein